MAGAQSGDGVSRHTHLVSIAGIKATAWTATTVCILLTTGRLIIRWRNLRRLSLDDIFNAVAAVLVVPFFIITLVTLPIDNKSQLHFLGYVDEGPTPADIEFRYQLSLASVLLFWLIIYAVKASFLALYWQIFAISTTFRIVWWLVAGYTAISFLVSWLAIFWQCGSPSHLLHLQVCESTETSLATNILIMWCTLNVVGGCLLMALPLVMVTTRMLTLTLSAKIGLLFIFSLVLIDIAFDVVRTVYSISETLTNETNLKTIWTFLEPTIAVIVCALPCYKGLITRIGSKRSSTVSEPSFGKSKHLQVTGIPSEMDLGSAFSLQSKIGGNNGP